MENSKLFSALSYFDKYEQNRLRKYIQSPYFNKNEGLVILFEEITKYHNKNKAGKKVKKLKSDFLWEKIYSDKKYDDVRFRKLRSDLLKLIQGFLAQQVYDGNPLHQATYLIEAIGKKHLTTLNDSSIRFARNIPSEGLFKPSDYYYHQFKIEKNYSDLNQEEFRKKANERVEEIANNLDRYYLSEKLKYYSFVLAHQYFISHEYKLLFIEEIFTHIEKHEYDDILSISIYYRVCKMLLDTENEAHYFKLKVLLDEHGIDLPDDESQTIYKYALNYCVRKINEGNLKFYSEYFDVYQFLLAKGMLFTEGVLATWHFNNIVVIALRLDKTSWVEKFINDYQEKLPDDSRENAVSYNLARLYFYQKKYDEVLALLNTVEYEEISYYLGAKTILIRTYYETEEIDALDFLLESFRTYISRQSKIPEQRKQNYKGFISFIRKLSRVTPGDQKAIKKIRAEFDKGEGIVSTDVWLKEKIEALEKGRK